MRTLGLSTSQTPRAIGAASRVEFPVGRPWDEPPMPHLSRRAKWSVALTLLVLAGCSRDRMAPNAPESSGGSSGVTSLSIRRPADVMRAIGIQNAHTPELMKIADVIGTGLSADAAGRPVIVVYTRRDVVNGVPGTIEGLTVQRMVTGVVVPYARPGGGTLEMGTSTGNDLECASGTLGCVVVKGGVRYFLSNNHVFARENAASNGERIDAPGRYDGKPRCAQTPQIANLSQFKAVSFSSNNTIDAAIAQPISGLDYSAAEAGGYSPSSTVVAPSVGLAVKKTGRTSGLTTGSIQAINVTIQVQYSSGQIATFVNQIQTPGSFIRSGDSGSLMVTQNGNNPVGLCFAGGSSASFANPIGDVLSFFNATVTGN
jgi:hypothetical protein